ncbi:MAG: type II toxin-antitoxin system HicB family antitoxin [Desulfovibrio sp.]|jgi:predicted HicB family RNase H-like nuclease|nr:type II toxin-antitoxin system HicB family antitoxin [Desulfovibrio sp.]
MKTLSYKGYQANIEFDGQDRIFVGHIAGIRAIVGFHGTSVDELEAAFHEAVEDYIDFCREKGIAPQRPYSGKIMLRVPPEIHARAAIQAQSAGKSLNQYVADVLKHAQG